MKRKDIGINDKRLLSWLYSDGNCCICHQKVGFFEEEKFIGEFAHIEDLRPYTDRYNEDTTVDERNQISNIMILCPTCHTKIDKNSSDYPVSKLVETKKLYEKNIALSRDYSNPKYYEEFDIICKEISKKIVNSDVEEKYINIEVENKITKNSLGDIENEIYNAMRYIPIFKEYLKTKPTVEQIDTRHKVMQLYLLECSNQDTNNIDKFNNIISNIVGRDLSKCFTAMVIICNYFEECDVFEV